MITFCGETGSFGTNIVLSFYCAIARIIVFTLKVHQMFCVNRTPEKFEYATITGRLEYTLEDLS